MELHITVQEQQLMFDILRHHQRELLLEIARASHHEFKTGLQERERLLERLLDKVAPAQMAGDRA